MGIVFRRFVRRVLFGAGVVLVGTGALAMGANLFRVVYVWHDGMSINRHWFFERGVVRYAASSGSAPAAQAARTAQAIKLLQSAPSGYPGLAGSAGADGSRLPSRKGPSSSVIGSLMAPPLPPPPSPWSCTIAQRVTPDDRAFVPYEWLPAYSDDGTTREVVAPWWVVVALGGAMMSAGLWGIRTPRGLCWKCEYDLRGLPAAASVCPECGAKLRVSNAPPLCASSTSARG